MTNIDIIDDICVIDKKPNSNTKGKKININQKLLNNKSSTSKSVLEFISQVDKNNRYDTDTTPSEKDPDLDSINYKPDLKRKRSELEILVLGDEEEIFQKINNEEEQIPKKVHAAPAPAWKDSDDANKVRVNVPVKLTTKTRSIKFKKTISGDKFASQLKSDFEKSYGTTPHWAKLSWEKDDSDSNSDDDIDSSIILKSTTSLKTNKSNYLSKSIIQMKKCVDVNKGNYSKCHLTSVQFHPTSQVLLTCGAASKNFTLYQVDGKLNPKIQSVHMENSPILRSRFTPSGSEVIMSTKFDKFFSYDMMNGKIYNHRLNRDLMDKRMNKFEISPDGKFIVFLGKYGQMYLLSAKTKELIATLKMNGEVTAVTFSGNHLVSTGDNGEVYIWDMNTRECIHRFYDEGCLRATSLAISPNKAFYAVGSDSGVVNIYSSKECTQNIRPKPLKALMNLTTEITDIKFNSTSELLAMSSTKLVNSIRMVHMDSLTVFKNFPDITDKIAVPWCFDFSRNSGYFSIGNSSGKALLYRVKHYAKY